MFNTKIKTRFPFISEFFEAATGVRRKLSHAYLLFGSDIYAQYAIAMEVARVLNCEASNNPGCSCVNCCWIKQNRHPAVITVSPIDYTYANKKGESKTVISIEQARYLREELLSSSQYHRVVILTDAAEGKEIHNKWQEFQQYDVLPPAKPDEDNIERIWIPQPLSRKTFQIYSSNALLKTIEEPSSNTTFIILTKDKEDVIETIVSRCQCLPVISKELPSKDLSPIGDLIQLLSPTTIAEALELSEKSLKIAKEEDINTKELLDMLAEYMRQNLSLNAENKHNSRKITGIIKKIEAGKSALTDKTNEQAVFDELFISLV